MTTVEIFLAESQENAWQMCRNHV